MENVGRLLGVGLRETLRSPPAAPDHPTALRVSHARRTLKNPLSEFPVGRKTRNRRLFAGRVPNFGFYDGISGERDRLCFANRGVFRPLLDPIEGKTRPR